MERDIFCADLTALLRETIDDGTEQPLVVTPTASLVPPLVELATDGVADGVRLRRRSGSKIKSRSRHVSRTPSRPGQTDRFGISPRNWTRRC